MDNRFFTNISAIVLDDHKLFADSFAKLVEFTSLFRTVNVFYHEQDLMQYLIRFRTTDTLYLFVDYYMGDRSLPAFLNDLKRLSRNIKVIVVSCISNSFLIHDLMKFSPDGIIGKTAKADALIDCIHEVANGGQYLSDEIREIMARDNGERAVPFTSREIELLRYFARGLSINDTAEELKLSRHTIAAHRRKMMAKTNTSSITGLLSAAQKLSVI